MKKIERSTVITVGQLLDQLSRYDKDLPVFVQTFIFDPEIMDQDNLNMHPAVGVSYYRDPEQIESIHILTPTNCSGTPYKWPEWGDDK